MKFRFIPKSLAVKTMEAIFVGRSSHQTCGCANVFLSMSPGTLVAHKTLSFLPEFTYCAFGCWGIARRALERTDRLVCYWMPDHFCLPCWPLRKGFWRCRVEAAYIFITMSPSACITSVTFPFLPKLTDRSL